MSAFSSARPIASVSELAMATNLTKSTAHRILNTLVQHGLIVQVPKTTNYCLGPRIMSLAEVARLHVSLEMLAEPTMTGLRDYTSETVALHVLDGTPMRRTVSQVESTLPLRRIYTDVGVPIPPHQGAPGKVLLAFSPEETQRRVLSRDLRDAVTHTRIDPDTLRQELSSVHEDGYAISIEGRVIGVVGVAVPVFQHDGTVVAALSISVPSVRADETKMRELVPRLVQGANEISRQLGA